MTKPRPLDLDRFEVITFDCYGTLIDWERGILNVLRPWADAHQIDADDETLLAIFAENEHICQRNAPTTPYPKILRQVHAKIAERFGLPDTQHEAEELAMSIADWPAFPDSPDALAKLAKRYRLIILSNIDRRSFAHSNARLGVKFDAIVTAEEVQSYKPDHGHFMRGFEICKELGISRDGILHVAQSLFHDHVPAKQLGLSTVWVNRRHGRSGGGATPPPPIDVAPDLIVPDLASLAKLIDAD